MNEYDSERTQNLHGSLKSYGGGSKEYLNLLFENIQSLFEIVGKIKDTQNGKNSTQDQTLATLQTELANLKEQHKSLTNKLWGLLAGIILAVVGGGVTIITMLLGA